MLIKRTHWLIKSYAGLSHIQFSFTKHNAYKKALAVCDNGLRKLFKVPNDVEWVRFCIYDKPTKNSVEFKLVRLCANYSYLRFSKNIQVYISEYVSDRRIRELLSQQSRYHVECEYL